MWVEFRMLFACPPYLLPTRRLLAASLALEFYEEDERERIILDFLFNALRYVVSPVPIFACNHGMCAFVDLCAALASTHLSLASKSLFLYQ